MLIVSMWFRGGGFGGARTIDLAPAGALIVDIIAWVWLVRPNFVHHQGEAYATALFETAETISPNKRK